MMNQGTSLCSGGSRGTFRARRQPPSTRAASRRRRISSDSTSTTGPSISTRTSLTSVPICTATAPIGAVAASTCGTA